MLRTLTTATAISGLMLSAAFAQTTTPPASSTPSATTPPASSSSASTTPSATDSARFVSAQQADQWLATKFKGTDVLGPNNEKVGDVNDLLFDKSGKILAVIVGVGGFLGIGEKDVALDMNAFQVVPASTTSSSSGTGTTGSGTGAGGATATTASRSDDPNNVKLKISMTKDQLKNAPTFERYRAPARTTGGASGDSTGSRPASRP